MDWDIKRYGTEFNDKVRNYKYVYMQQAQGEGELCLSPAPYPSSQSTPTARGGLLKSADMSEFIDKKGAFGIGL